MNFLPREMPCKTEAHFRPSNRPSLQYKPLEYWIAGEFRHKERLSGSCGDICKNKYKKRNL